MNRLGDADEPGMPSSFGERMLIPVGSERPEDFLTRAASAIADAETHLYVDTSLAMWLTTIGPGSRAQFLDWSATLDGRIHVPAWTLQEYYSHHRARTLKTEIDAQCETVTKAAAEFRSQLRHVADAPLLAGVAESTFVERVDNIRDELRTLAAAAKGWNYEEASSQVIEWMNQHSLGSSTIFDGFDRLKEAGGARYAHRVPPGYEDRRKGLNRYGDLLFWQDVVADAHRRRAGTVVVLTRDRKEDWYGTGPEPEVGAALRRLRSRWEPVPLPHPMLTFELRTTAASELLLLDDLYLGAILWRADKTRYGRVAAVALEMSAEKLGRELAPPLTAHQRAAGRRSEDRVSLREAFDLLTAAQDREPDGDALVLIEALTGDAPAADGALDAITPDWLGTRDPQELAMLGRRLSEMAGDEQPFVTTAALRMLDAVDQLDSARASAAVGGMLVGAYYDGRVPRARPRVALLRELQSWAADPGCERVLKALTSRLVGSHSAALVLPDMFAHRLSIRIDASNAIVTAPPTVGQVHAGAQPLLTAQLIGDELALQVLLGGREISTASEIADALAKHFGVPSASLQLRTSSADDEWRIPDTTGIEAFSSYKLPNRGEVPAMAPGFVTRPTTAAVEEDMENEDDGDDPLADDIDDEGDEH